MGEQVTFELETPDEPVDQEWENRTNLEVFASEVDAYLDNYEVPDVLEFYNDICAKRIEVFDKFNLLTILQDQPGWVDFAKHSCWRFAVWSYLYQDVPPPDKCDLGLLKVKRRDLWFKVARTKSTELAIEWMSLDTKYQEMHEAITGERAPSDTIGSGIQNYLERKEVKKEANRKEKTSTSNGRTYLKVPATKRKVSK